MIVPDVFSRGPEHGQPGDRADQCGQADLVYDTGHQRLDLGRASFGVVAVGQEESHPFQCPTSVRDHSGGVGQDGEQVARDPQRGLECAPPNDLAPHAPLEPVGAQSASPFQVVAAAVADRRQGGEPGVGPERLLRGVQRRRPHALQQRPHLLDLAGHRDDQLIPTGTKVPQSSPCLVDGSGHVATQLRGHGR
ncbi:hypothetical protein [Saccharothrix stipae]